MQKVRRSKLQKEPKSRQEDLVIEDDLETECFLGRGLDNLIDSTSTPAKNSLPGNVSTRRNSHKCIYTAPNTLRNDATSHLHYRTPRYNLQKGPKNDVKLPPLTSAETTSTTLSFLSAKSNEQHVELTLPSTVSSVSISTVLATDSPVVVANENAVVCETNNEEKTGQKEELPRETERIPPPTISLERNRLALQVLERKKRLEDRLKQGRMLWIEWDTTPAGLEKKNQLSEERLGDTGGYNVSKSSISSPTSPMKRTDETERPEMKCADVAEYERKPIESQVVLPPPSKDIVPRRLKEKEGVLLDMETIMALKFLLFGASHRSFGEEWRSQNFVFRQDKKIPYGLIQKRRGPDGVLTAVQAELIRDILFEQKGGSLRISPEKRSIHLANTLTRILCRCGERTRVCILQTQRGTYVDGISENVLVYEFADEKQLKEFLQYNISQFEYPGCPGLVLLLYSAILSRGIDRCHTDMDISTGRLIDPYGCSGQELTNLMLTGRTVSHTFNDDMLRNGDAIYGLNGRSDIGFLTLVNHCQMCRVESYYRTPRYPVWVACLDGQTFGVLFSVHMNLVSDWKMERIFDINYYSCLDKKIHPIRLSINNVIGLPKPVGKEDDDDQDEDEEEERDQKDKTKEEISPLELCIRCKWPEALIDWNGSAPIFL